MNDQGKSGAVASAAVVYVHRSLTINPAVAAVQQVAMQSKVPFAVLYCAENIAAVSSCKSSLLQLETSLRSNNIPLIVMVGNEQRCVDALKHHLAPLTVIDSNLSTSNEHSLEKHPYDWPGVVLSVTDLMNAGDMCVM